MFGRIRKKIPPGYTITVDLDLAKEFRYVHFLNILDAIISYPHDQQNALNDTTLFQPAPLLVSLRSHLHYCLNAAGHFFPFPLCRRGSREDVSSVASCPGGVPLYSLPLLGTSFIFVLRKHLCSTEKAVFYTSHRSFKVHFRSLYSSFCNCNGFDMNVFIVMSNLGMCHYQSVTHFVTYFGD